MSFFGTLVHRRGYLNRGATRCDLFAYIEAYCKRQRIHSAIDYITPDQAEGMSAHPVSALPWEAHHRPRRGSSCIRPVGWMG